MTHCIVALASRQPWRWLRRPSEPPPVLKPVLSESARPAVLEPELSASRPDDFRQPPYLPIMALSSEPKRSLKAPAVMIANRLGVQQQTPFDLASNASTLFPPDVFSHAPSVLFHRVTRPPLGSKAGGAMK